VQFRLDFETPHFLHSLFADNVSLLKDLDHVLDIHSVTRDGWILFSGDEEDVEKAKTLFQDLEEARRNGATITEKDFKTALQLHSNSDGSPETSLTDITRTQLLKKRDGKPITPRTPGQASYIQAMQEHHLTFGLGPAGTGKTYLAMAMALTMLKQGNVKKIILTRPAVEAGEALGFLPGDLQEKVAPYLRPLYDALDDIVKPDLAQRWLEDGTIDIAPLAYMRGRTLARSFVILDEAQNTTPEQMFMFLTRLGEGSHCVVTGDLSQIDLPSRTQSGLKEAVTALAETPTISINQLTNADILRHPIVADIIRAYNVHRQNDE